MGSDPDGESRRGGLPRQEREAPSRETTSDDSGGTFQSVAFATATGFGGFAAIVVWQVLLVSLLAAPGERLSDSVATVVGTVALGLGTASAALLYFRVTDRDLSFVDVRWPSLRDVGYAVAGVVGLFAALVGIQVLLSLVGVESAQHGISQTATESPEVLLVLIPASWLIVGPGEELLFRNVVQKSLYPDLPRSAAVVVASVVFAAVHFQAYSTGTPGQMLASLSLVFALSLILGGVYARTDNLVVPAFVHGTFNAVQFAVLYYSLEGAAVPGALLAVPV